MCDAAGWARNQFRILPAGNPRTTLPPDLGLLVGTVRRASILHANLPPPDSLAKLVASSEAGRIKFTIGRCKAGISSATGWLVFGGFSPAGQRLEVFRLIPKKMFHPSDLGEEQLGSEVAV